MEVDDTTTTVRKTYNAGSTSLAVRTIVNETTETLNWLLSDHLGSSSITTTADGTWNSEIRYSAFGETRYSSGITPTVYRYTGQLEQADVNLYYYNARYYDAALGRFIQADTIIPSVGDLQSYDRYTYVSNNPVIYTDPSGHNQDCGINDPYCNAITHEMSYETYASYTPYTPSTLWIVVCGTDYACTGNQSGGNQNFDDLPAYNRWEDEILKHGGYSVAFVETPEEGRFSGYNIDEYATSIEAVMAESDADIINFLCHSRGGQTCTHLINTNYDDKGKIIDDRIGEAFMIEGSAQNLLDAVPGIHDTVDDLLNLFNEGYKITMLVSNNESTYSLPYGTTADHKFTNFKTNDQHNELVYTLEVIQWILTDYETRH
ncbi:MAG: RHS repeat-associated core domain-containing protein [Anaerolineaceae bacterium]|nr:RHS repeat-associated core domain-containing protein [Anaerolineaceae bacterium]